MSKKHGLIMIACCLIALGAAMAVFLFKVPANNALIILMFLFCPLSHLMMMGMLSHKGNEHNQSSVKSPESSPQELGRG